MLFQAFFLVPSPYRVNYGAGGPNHSPCLTAIDRSHADSIRISGYDAGMDWLTNWKLRHQNPISFALHMVGIPLTIAAVVLAIVQLVDARWDLWWRPTVLLVAGYALQWVGHCIEGNTMGEVILINRWLGRPYTAIAPRYQSPEGDPAEHSKQH